MNVLLFDATTDRLEPGETLLIYADGRREKVRNLHPAVTARHSVLKQPSSHLYATPEAMNAASSTIGTPVIICDISHTCGQCGSKFAAKRMDARYCSARCRQSAARRMAVSK